MKDAMMRTSDTLDELANALSAAQGEFPIIEKAKVARVKDWAASSSVALREYRYADLADVLRGVLPVLSKNKLAILQPTYVEAGTIFIRTRLVHASGQWIECEYPVSAITVDHQRMGSALTYAKRYALCSLLGVASDEDIDGAAALPAAPRSAIPRPLKRTGRVIVAKPSVTPLPPMVSKPPHSGSDNGRASGVGTGHPVESPTTTKKRPDAPPQPTEST
jgi:hypothetical protein